MAGITFKNVAKRFGEVSVIENLDLEIHDHEFMVFVPSCGSSAALKLSARKNSKPTHTPALVPAMPQTPKLVPLACQCPLSL